MQESVVPIFPGAGGLNTNAHETNIEVSQASAIENVAFDRQSIESPGGARKLNRDVPVATGLGFAPPSIVQAAADVDAATVPWAFVPYHEAQDPETEWQLDVSFRLNHRTNDCLTGANQNTNVINAPKGGEFQFQPLVQRGGDDVTRLQWVLGACVVNPAGGSGAAEFIRPVFYWWDAAAGRLKFSAAFTVLRPGEDYHIQLQLGATAAESRWIVNGEEKEQITDATGELIVALPAAEDLYDASTKRALYIGKGVTRTTGVGRYAEAKQIAGVYNNSASAWSATSITASPALPVTSSDAWKGYFARRVQDGVIRQVTTSTGSTLTFAASSWSSPSASDEFDLIPPMEACHQDCTIQEVRLWAERQYLRQWDYSSPHAADGFLPQIRMQPGNEATGQKAFLYRSDTGAVFKPRGVNLLLDGAHWPILTTGWDEATIRATLQDAINRGWNTVRIVLDGSKAPTYFLDSTAEELPDEYVENTARLLELATEAGVYVSIALGQFAFCTRYLTTLPAESGVADVTVTAAGSSYTIPDGQFLNRSILSPRYHYVREVFLEEWSALLRKHLSDSRYESALLCLEIQNESEVNCTYVPMRESERIQAAVVTNTPSGGPWNMSLDADRQNMMLDNMVATLNADYATMKRLWPDTLVGLSVFTNAAVGKVAPDLRFLQGATVNLSRHPWPMSEIQDQVNCDFFSIHVYIGSKRPGSATFEMEETLETNSFSAIDQYLRPIIMGETGIPKGTYPTLDATTKALFLTSVETAESLGFAGFLWWVYGLGDNTLASSTSNFYLANEDGADEAWVRTIMDPSEYPAYAEQYRSETLGWAIQPGQGTSDERDAITRFEGLNRSKLIGYWPLNDDGGVMLRDYSAAANHGWMKGLPFETTQPGEVLLDGERTAIQLDLDEEPDLYGAWRHSLGANGRVNVCVRARVRICRDLEDNGEASIEDCLYETLFDWDNPKATSADPILSVRWTKHDGTRKFYMVWNTGSGQEIIEIASSVESNPQTSATLAQGLQPAPGREFTLLAGIQTTDGDASHRVYCFVLDADGNAIGSSENWTPTTPVVQADLAKSRISFGASVVGEELKGSGTKNAGMLLFRDVAMGLHPVVDTQSATTSLQSSMELSPFVSHGQLDVVQVPIGADAGLISVDRNSTSFSVVGSGTLVKDRRHYPKNWLATIPSISKVRTRENRVPFGRPKFVAITDVTATGGTLGDLWDEPDQDAISISLALWLAATDFPRETDALSSNPMPRDGEPWALTALWSDKGVLGSVDPVPWYLAIIPSRAGTAQEGFAPRWTRGIVKAFESIRGQAQVDIRPGDRHHIAAVGGSLYKNEQRRVADHPFFGEECPRGGTYGWCVQYPERPIWLSQAEELRQPKRLSVPREGDPWPEDGMRYEDEGAYKWWIPNNRSTATYWLLESWIKIPSVWGRRTISSRVGTEQGATSLVRYVNHWFYLDAGAPEFLIADDLNSRSFRMFLGNNAKMKMRDVVKPNVWTHLAVMVNVTTSGAISAGDNGFFVNGQRLTDVHQEIIGAMTCAQIPDNVTQAFLGVFGQDQATRFTPWAAGLRGRQCMTRIRTSANVIPDFEMEKW